MATRVIEFVLDDMSMRIPVPTALIRLPAYRLRGRQAWAKGELVCWHALLTITSCLTTRVLATDDERDRVRKALVGFLACLAHYFPQWFGAPEICVTEIGPHFRREEYQPVSKPVASRLFRDWTLRVLLGVSGGSREEEDLLAAYAPETVDKTMWAHPVWTMLHMLPSSAPFVFPDHSSRPFCPVTESLYFKALLVALAELIPCPQCRSHKWEYCSGKAVESEGYAHAGGGSAKLSFRNYLGNWVWEFHNDVNARLGAQPVPADRAVRFWDAQARGWWGEAEFM